MGDEGVVFVWYIGYIYLLVFQSGIVYVMVISCDVYVVIVILWGVGGVVEVDYVEFVFKVNWDFCVIFLVEYVFGVVIVVEVFMVVVVSELCIVCIGLFNKVVEFFFIGNLGGKVDNIVLFIVMQVVFFDQVGVGGVDG